MVIYQRMVAMLLTAVLVSLPCFAAIPTLGVVTLASAAHLGHTATSAGTTLFDGDQLSTDSGGKLELRLGSSSVYLAAQSGIKLSGSSNSARVQLTAGTLIWNASRVDALDVSADDAHLRPMKDQVTSAQVSVVGPKELYVLARKGSFDFSYRNEKETIAEGESFEVILDPDQKTQVWGSSQPKKPARRRKGFIFFLLGASAAVAGFTISSAMESPSKP